MEFQESETIELKSIVNEDIKKEIIAFANCVGGTIYVGVMDNGDVVGVENPDSVALQISNMVRDGIRPDLSLLMHYETIKIQEKTILSIKVERGIDRPYYLAAKGLRSSGVYIRQGYSCVPATESTIRRIIAESDGDSFEERRSLDQNLTFNAAMAEHSKRGVDFGKLQMKSLNIINTDDLYTNLGLLVSDQCLSTIKVGVFKGTDKIQFRSRGEFSGSIFQQLNECYDFVEKYNQLGSEIKGLYRIDTYDYPKEAIREALLNMIVHRDYSLSGSALISIFDDRIEFLSLGGLVPGIDMEDVKMGVSLCRNPKLANVFYRLKLIECYGTGIPKIFEEYKSSRKKPILEASPNAFKITLPNMNYRKESERPVNCLNVMKVSDPKEDKILDYLGKHRTATRAELERVINSSSSSAIRTIRRMVNDGTIRKEGAGKNTIYFVA